MFFKIVVLKNFAIFIGKHLCLESLYNKVAALKVFSLKVFSCEYWENFKNNFFIDHLRWRG